MQYNTNLSLKNYNSLGLESIAKEIWFPENQNELMELVKSLGKDNFYILSKGTNVLLNKTINKIICLRNMDNEIYYVGDGYIFADCNCSTQTLVKQTIKEGLGGLEGLIGIPGTVGGAITMNAGSKDYSIKDCLLSISVIDNKGDLKNYTKKDLKFKRRYSIIQDTHDIIIRSLFKLNKGINQKDLIYYKNSRKNIPKDKSAGGIFINWHELKIYEKKLIGLSDGDAVISDRVNVIVNKGKASAQNILNLIDKVRNIVKRPLHLEIKLVGFDNE